MSERQYESTRRGADHRPAPHSATSRRTTASAASTASAITAGPNPAERAGGGHRP